MPRYDITVREVWNQTFTVYADSPEEARQMIRDGEGETMHGSFEYNRTMDEDTWDVAVSTESDDE